MLTIGGRLLGALLQALVIAFLARSLGVDEYGVFVVISSVSLFVLSMADLGMSTIVLRLTEPDQRARVLVTVAIWRAAMTVVVVAILTAVGVAIDSQSGALFVTTAVYVSGETAGDLAVAILQGQLKAGVAVSVLLLRRATAVLPFLFGLGQLQAETSLIAAGSVGLAAFFVSALRRPARPASLRTLLADNISIVITTASRNLTTLDSAVVGSVGGVQLAGLYGASARLFAPLNLAVATLVQVLIPELSSTVGRSNKLVKFRAARRWVVLFAVGVGALSLFSTQVVVIFFGDDFVGAAPIAAAVFIAAGISAISQVHMSWFYANKVPRLVVVGAVFTGVGGIAALAILTAYFGALGAAAAFVLWRASTLVVVLIAWRQEIRRPGNAD